jgi:hypothetical protein
MIGEMVIVGLEDGFDDDGAWNVEAGGRVSLKLFSKCLALWLLQCDGTASLAETIRCFNTTSFVIRQAVNWRSTLSSDDVGKIVFTGNCLSARNEITDDDMISLIELIARAQNRQLTVSELAEIVRVDNARIDAALAAYVTWSQRHRPGLNFDLADRVVQSQRTL